MKPDRYCCDGLCNENQGRGGCPARDESMSAEARLTRSENRQILAGIVVAVCVWAAVIGYACFWLWRAFA